MEHQIIVGSVYTFSIYKYNLFCSKLDLYTIKIFLDAGIWKSLLNDNLMFLVYTRNGTYLTLRKA